MNTPQGVWLSPNLGPVVCVCVCVCVSWLTENKFLMSMFPHVESLCVLSGKEGWRQASDEGILCGIWSVSAGGSWVVSQDPGGSPENGRGLCACPPHPQLAQAVLSVLLGRQPVSPHGCWGGSAAVRQL